MGGRSVTTYNFNGQVPGPTFRLRSGVTLGITLSNQLDESTNLHTHGLHVSPAGNSDNVLLQLMPGETFAYEFAISPMTHRGSTSPASTCIPPPA